jgi:ribosome-associated protein
MRVRDDLTIPDEELTFKTSRSSGPGGQNVNKVESRVTLLFDLEGSPSLTEEQKRLLHTRLSSRINKEGVLRVVSQKHRTQAANRASASERFAELVAEALVEHASRRPTKVSRAAQATTAADGRRLARPSHRLS